MKAGVALLIAVAAAAAIAAGTSWAYFKTSGTGSGTGLVGTTQAVTLSPATPATALYPGGSADVALTVSNSNSNAVTIPSLALDASRGTNGLGVDNAHAGCDLSALSFSPSGGGWTIPANAGAYPIDLAGGMSMAASAVDACQGAAFTVYLKVGP